MRRIDLGGRPTSRDELAAWYSAALDAQAASGLSVAAYAERVGVSAWTLYQWRRRLSSSTGRRRRHANLVEVTIARPSRATGGGCLVVLVNEGRRSIEVPRGFDTDELRRVVTALESC
jgi:hypothetical protein